MKRINEFFLLNYQTLVHISSSLIRLPWLFSGFFFLILMPCSIGINLCVLKEWCQVCRLPLFISSRVHALHAFKCQVVNWVLENFAFLFSSLASDILLLLSGWRIEIYEFLVGRLYSFLSVALRFLPSLLISIIYLFICNIGEVWLQKIIYCHIGAGFHGFTRGWRRPRCCSLISKIECLIWDYPRMIVTRLVSGVINGVHRWLRPLRHYFLLLLLCRVY